MQSKCIKLPSVSPVVVKFCRTSYGQFLLTLFSRIEGIIQHRLRCGTPDRAIPSSHKKCCPSFPCRRLGGPYSDHLCMSTCELSWTGVALLRWFAEISDEVGRTDITKSMPQTEGASNSHALYKVKHVTCSLRKYIWLILCASSPSDVIHDSWKTNRGSPHSWRYTPDPTAKAVLGRVCFSAASLCPDASLLRGRHLLSRFASFEKWLRASPTLSRVGCQAERVYSDSQYIYKTGSFGLRGFCPIQITSAKTDTVCKLATLLWKRTKEAGRGKGGKCAFLRVISD